MIDQKAQESRSLELKKLISHASISHERLDSKRKTYPEEFKRQAVQLCEERGNITAVSRELGVDHNLLRGWKKRLLEGTEKPFPGRGNPHDAEFAQLKRENARLKEDNEILK